MKLLPFIPLSKPLRGADDAQQFDAGVFDAHPSCDGYVRPMVEGEFIDQPRAMQRALTQPLMRPFRHVVQVLQVRLVEGFDPARAGVLRGGFLSNTANDRQPKSKGALSLEFYAPPAK